MELDYHDTIADALNVVGREFAPDELGYLALTSKIEAPIRDRLAFQLHRRLEPKGMIVAREWKRADIAILDGVTPKALIELKAMYTFDPLRLKRGDEYSGLMMKDALKSLRSSSQAFVLLLATHPVTLPTSPHYANVIKYLPAIRRALRERENNADRVLSEATTKIEEQMMGLNSSKKTPGVIGTGNAFGGRVALHYWLIGPCDMKLPE